MSKVKISNQLANPMDDTGLSKEHQGAIEKAIALAIRCHKAGEIKQATELFAKVLNIDPRNSRAMHCLGVIANTEKQYGAAYQLLSQVVRLEPDNAQAHQNLGRTLLDLKRPQDAVVSLTRAVDLQPDFALAHNNLGVALALSGNSSGALDAYKLGVKNNPKSPTSLRNLAGIYRKRMDLPNAIINFRKALDLNPKDYSLHSDLLFCLATSPEVSPEKYIEEAKKYGIKVSERISKYEHWDCHPDRLRVGFVSADLRNHAVTKLCRETFRELSNLDIELIAYSAGSEDKITELLRPCFNEWNQVEELSDRSLAEKIHKDGIDILVDMSGHTAKNRLPVFAYRAAPIQASWLGYFASTGIAEIDYVMANPVVCPDRHDPAFTEEIWQMKGSQCLTIEGVKVDRSFDLSPYERNGYFTFGCVNRIDKMRDDVISLWADILHDAPDAKFYVDSPQFSDEGLKEEFISKFAKFGISKDRLILVSHDGTYAGYLSCFKNIDLALDTFPYSGSTVNLESLWMGCVYLSLLGEGLIARAGSAFLTDVGLEELVAESRTEYRDKAIDIYNSPEKLRKLKKTLEASINDSVFFNPKIFAEELYSAFLKMKGRSLDAG